MLLSFVCMNSNSHTTSATISKGFAVVELFTSEGCSSCPAADEVIAELLKKNVAKTYILSFHVDYWNKLGWKDQFSKPEYSARQLDYARSLNLQGAYTPQVVVNGTSEFVGSDENALSKSITDNLKNGSESALKITALKKVNSITLHYNITGTENILLNCAIILPEVTTQVRRGENGGRTLHHVNIVKSLKVVNAKGSGELLLEIPDELVTQKFKIIAFTQTKDRLQIIGVDEVDF